MTGSDSSTKIENFWLKIKDFTPKFKFELSSKSHKKYHTTHDNYLVIVADIYIHNWQNSTQAALDALQVNTVKFEGILIIG